eukprot:gnl/TRDRNA2_/TRDRNA2_80123_c0_seq1.p1 gnl/TRDRNA2_/TRDRNA2_80123_c0~~gnl/TRDRNA2_/TRDRNA2_80123_c0_seq1.p1  ORF type:complete len:299 (+),score=45.39 gnl/TRDRNA2_/TRDRNA2_80123_c0_seq1:47-943(+)
MGNDVQKGCQCQCNDDCYDAASITEMKSAEGAWQEEICNAEMTPWRSPFPPRPGGSSNEARSVRRHENYNDSSVPDPVPGPDGLYRFNFSLRPGDLGAQFVELVDPRPGGSLVASQVDLKAPLSRCGPGPGLVAGDLIVEVNGRRGNAVQLNAALKQAASQGGNLALAVRPRPPVFDVEMVRQGYHWDRLGLSVVIDKAEPDRIRVRAVRDEGLVPIWNASHGPLQVCVGDWITEVDGAPGTSNQLYTAIQGTTEGSSLQLRIVAPPRSAPYQDAPGTVDDRRNPGMSKYGPAPPSLR